MAKKKESKEPVSVWVKCRTTRPCGGNTAVVKRQIKNNYQNGNVGYSRITHYKCTSCGGTFTIAV